MFAFSVFAAQLLHDLCFLVLKLYKTNNTKNLKEAQVKLKRKGEILGKCNLMFIMSSIIHDSNLIHC